MRAQEVLDMATLCGAKALNWNDDIGSVEVGKKADLIALNLRGLTNSIPQGQELDSEAIASSIVYSTQSSHLEWSMIDGSVLYKNGKVRGLSTANLMQRVRLAQATIAKQLRKK